MPQIAANEPIGLSYAHIAGAATTTVKPTAGLLQGVIINAAPSGATITIYDSLTAAAPIIAVVTLGAAETVAFPDLTYGVNFKTGLTIVTTGSTLDLTVVYK